MTRLPWPCSVIVESTGIRLVGAIARTARCPLSLQSRLTVLATVFQNLQWKVVSSASEKPQPLWVLRPNKQTANRLLNRKRRCSALAKRRPASISGADTVLRLAELSEGPAADSNHRSKRRSEELITCCRRSCRRSQHQLVIGSAPHENIGLPPSARISTTSSHHDRSCSLPG